MNNKPKKLLIKFKTNSKQILTTHLQIKTKNVGTRITLQSSTQNKKRLTVMATESETRLILSEVHRIY